MSFIKDMAIKKASVPEELAPLQTPTVGYATRLGLDQVDLFVGPEKRHLRVSKAILCSKIPYFNKMFNGGFKEALEKSATFPEDSPDGFELLIEWVYTGAYKQFEGRYPQTMAPAFVGVYCLAEKFCVPALADYSMNSLRTEYILTSRYPSFDVIEAAYTTSVYGSCLRRYMARSVHHSMKKAQEAGGAYSAEGMSVFLVKFPELLKDVIVLMRNVETAERTAGNKDFVWSPKALHPCEFHLHARNEPCQYK